MLNKLLNPFNIKSRRRAKLFVYLGMASATVLHIAFYVTIFHFIHKAW